VIKHLPIYIRASLQSPVLGLRRSQHGGKADGRDRERCVSARRAAVIGVTSVDEKVVGSAAQDLDRTRVHGAGGGSVQLPLVRVAAKLVGEHTHAVRIGDDDRTERAAVGGPDDVGRRVRRRPVAHDERYVLVLAKLERSVGNDVVNRVVLAIAGRVSDRGFVND
jgi:hypothetical protein